jgi:hypothetical protein
MSNKDDETSTTAGDASKKHLFKLKWLPQPSSFLASISNDNMNHDSARSRGTYEVPKAILTDRSDKLNTPKLDPKIHEPNVPLRNQNSFLKFLSRSKMQMLKSLNKKAHTTLKRRA